MIIDLNFIKNKYNLDNETILQILDSNKSNILELYDKKFNKDFYEKTYNFNFDSYESAYNHWKITKKTGYLGYPFVKNNITYNGQILQDYIIINDLFNNTQMGTFVEFGACDGLFLSNTLILEKHFDWNGLLIEGLDEYYQQLQKSRKAKTYQTVLYNEDGKELEFVQKDKLEVSGIVDKLYNNNNNIEKKILIKSEKLETVFDKLNFNKTIHFMSVDVEGAEYEILKVFPFDKYKIYSLTIEHGYNKELKNDINKLMESNGYILYKELLWDNIYILPELITKKCVNSFDFFDTLVHRYYNDENSILQIIEKEYKLENFIKIRKTIEFSTEGTLTNIYTKIYELKPEWKHLDLETIEFELDKQYLIPNNIMINKIKSIPNTIIISDTFYSEQQITSMCKKFDIDTKIFTSRSGKKDGWIYDKLVKEYIIIGHYGDNQISDITNSNIRCINSKFICDKNLSIIENKVYSSNMQQFSYLLRTCRLLSNSDYSLEFSLIFGINLLIGEVLNRKLQDLNLNKILFTQRDCCHLANIFKIFYPKVDSEKFYTSRQALDASNSTFVDYYKKSVNNDCIIFDMNGTGYSTFNFCKNNNIILTNNTKLIFACLFYNLKSKKISNEFIINMESLFNDNSIIDLLEIINTDIHGKTINYDGIPIKTNVEYDLTVVNLIHASISKLLNYLSDKRNLIDDYLNNIKNIDTPLIKNIIIFMIKYLKSSPFFQVLHKLVYV